MLSLLATIDTWDGATEPWCNKCRNSIVCHSTLHRQKEPFFIIINYTVSANFQMAHSLTHAFTHALRNSFIRFFFCSVHRCAVSVSLPWLHLYFCANSFALMTITYAVTTTECADCIHFHCFETFKCCLVRLNWNSLGKWRLDIHPYKYWKFSGILNKLAKPNQTIKYTTEMERWRERENFSDISVSICRTANDRTGQVWKWKEYSRPVCYTWLILDIIFVSVDRIWISGWNSKNMKKK